MGTYMVKIIRVVLQQSFVLFQNRGTRLKFYCLLIVFFHVYNGFEMYFRRSIITDMMVQVENGAIWGVIMVHVITCCFFVCLGFPLENFSLIWRRHHFRWRAAHPDPCWALSEGFLARHIYCDTWHPFIIVISEDQWQSHLLPSVCQCSYHYLFLYVMSLPMKQTGLMLYKQQLTKNNLENFSERYVSKGFVITDKAWGLHKVYTIVVLPFGIKNCI